MSNVWLLTYEVVPEPANPAFRRCGGAFVNCWIRAESQDAAVDTAIRQLTATNWRIVELAESKPVNPQIELYPPASMKLIEEAQIDGAAFCFNQWPA